MIKQDSTIFTRRRILAALGLGGAAAAVAAPPLPLSWTRKPDAIGSWWDGSGGSLETGAMDAWRSKVGSSFTVEGENGRAILKLIEVQALESKGRRPSSLARERAFAAGFEAQGTAPAGDRTYTVANDADGRMDIFVGPANLSGPKPRLEAVFN
jgi:hypothetical protein